ncbi:hypothetical protein G9C98_007428 [Cotesia typhae]|uniref:Potassium channel voltage dependent KCNQ C-terminal domain-containing protein n=1 Tax=Cotesia typhae TaxID=2053667 RepID=A0A8J5UNX6_9HYME|nr:hypothetical protein G9C98_007428 [Cotesia typhae]
MSSRSFTLRLRILNLRLKLPAKRLDQILGRQGSKARDVYVSKISLASRVVKVERQVDDIETKLDQLIELYVEDRKRFLSLPLPKMETRHVPNSSSAITEEPNVTTVLKPILVDKQLSEPSSPTSKTIRYTKQQKPRQIYRVTVECDPDRGSEYNTENDTEDTGEEAALLGSSESPLTNSPGSINPGGNTDPMK